MSSQDLNLVVCKDFLSFLNNGYSLVGIMFPWDSCLRKVVLVALVLFGFVYFFLGASAPALNHRWELVEAFGSFWKLVEVRGGVGNRVRKVRLPKGIYETMQNL